MEVGALTAYISYLMQIVMSVMMATFMLMMVPRAAVCADRIAEVLDTEPSIEPPANPVTELPEPGTLRFNDVSFAYPGADAPVLRGVSFAAVPGQTVAIVGSTGAGKSTLVSLVPRLFDATAGAVRVGGVDVRAEGKGSSTGAEGRASLVRGRSLLGGVAGFSESMMLLGVSWPVARRSASA